MPEVEARLETLATLERATRAALELADRCDEHMIAIRLDEALGCICERMLAIKKTGIL